MAWCDAQDVEEDMVRAVAVGQTVSEPTGVPLGVVAAVAHEHVGYRPRHGCRFYHETR